MQVKPLKETKPQDPKTVVVLQAQPVSIKLEVLSDYHHCGSFVNDLENAQELIVVEEIRIAANPDDTLRQRVALMLKTYVKK